MGLAPKTRLGSYEIISALGAGGMGEVYRARDTKLGREVALKVLPEAFAADAGRMARFEREAKVLASLNHPNIASIHGFEDSAGVRALVMEVVEGQTLAERISGVVGAGLKPAPTNAISIPIDEALPIAKQICEGLEYAHERGIIHRDLKPANVKVTPDGTVKILDFGLAKALEGDVAQGEASTSPTLSRLATQAGIILGTAAYMSPEQAKGKPMDRRADIWAFGCVLYEMLSGKQAFGGETVTDVLAAVVRAEPDWAALPADTSLGIRMLLGRCLNKDVRQRLQAIGEARISLEQGMAGGAGKPAGAAAGDSAPAPAWRRAMPWTIAGACMILAGLFAAGYLARAPKSMPAYIAELPPPANAIYALVGFNAGPPVLSRDGLRIAFCAKGYDGRQLLWVRSLDGRASQPLEGADGASYPFWSADSRSIGFFAQGKLKRIDAAGGPALVVADATIGRGGSWGPDGTILYVPDQVGGIYRVGASGGTPKPVTELNGSLKQINHRWPQFLPDGKHFLFLALSANGELSGTYAGSLDGGEPKLIVRGGSNAIYAPPGYLVFVREGALMAQRFDTGRLELEGEAVPLGENAAVDPTANVARGVFDVSANGVLVFAGGAATGFGSLLSWFDRTGKPLRQTGSPGEYATITLSPDGKKLAVGALQPNGLLVFDLSRGTSARVTFGEATGGANAGQPAWSPDGRTLAFFSSRTGLYHIFQQAADGTGITTPLFADDASETYPAWSPDGRYLVFNRQAAEANANVEIWAMPLAGDRKAFPVVRGAFSATWPAISPDGNWLAYTSSESGREEIYVVPFLHGSGKWVVSTGGGNRPRWRRDGEELFYLSPDDHITAAEILAQGTSFSVGKVEPLFQASPAGNPGWRYDVSADGKEFVIVSRATERSTSPVTLVVNWPALLRKQ